MRRIVALVLILSLLGTVFAAGPVFAADGSGSADAEHPKECSFGYDA